MKDLFGSEAHHKKWKLYLILDRHGYGFFQKNVKHLTAQFITKSLTIKNLRNSNKTLMVDNSSYMVKELY